MGDNRDCPEGRPPRETGASRPFLRSGGGPTHPAVACPFCGRWEWREIQVASSGWAVVQRWCPKCQARRLIVVRGSELFGVSGLSGRDVGSLTQALEEAGMPKADVAMILAAVMGGHDCRIS